MVMVGSWGAGGYVCFCFCLEMKRSCGWFLF